MKVLVLTTLLAALCVAQCLAVGDVPTCPPPGSGTEILLFPKPDNCSQYYECDNGKLLIMDCPAGLHFNAVNKTCDFTWSAQCKESRKIELYEVKTQDVPSCPPPGSGTGILLFPKPDNCSQYYECDNGKLLIMDCPAGLEFNAKNLTCDFTWSAECKVSRLVYVLEIEQEESIQVEDVPSCPPPGSGQEIQLFPKPDNCSQYYECDNGKLLIMDCPAGLEFNAKNLTCDFSWSAGCTVSRSVFIVETEEEESDELEDVPTCPPPGSGQEIQLFPKPDNCSQYYECDNGKLLIMDCPAGLEFNAKNLTCDFSWSAGCKVSRSVFIVETEEEESDELEDVPSCPPPGSGQEIQLFPKPDNCSQYYECDNGKLLIMDCPAGLEFNAKNLTCDFSWSAGCKVSRSVFIVETEEEESDQLEDVPTCPPPGSGTGILLFPKPDNCSQYYECDNGKLLIMDCPAGLEFNAKNLTCDFSWSAGCKVSRGVVLFDSEEEESVELQDVPNCPPPGSGQEIQLFPKPDNCSQYYECDNGKLLIMDCPAGLEFNARNLTCDFSWSAGCTVSHTPVHQVHRSLPHPRPQPVILYDLPEPERKHHHK